MDNILPPPLSYTIHSPILSSHPALRTTSGSFRMQTSWASSSSAYRVAETESVPPAVLGKSKTWSSTPRSKIHVNSVTSVGPLFVPLGSIDHPLKTYSCSVVEDRKKCPPEAQKRSLWTPMNPARIERTTLWNRVRLRRLWNHTRYRCAKGSCMGR